MHPPRRMPLPTCQTIAAATPPSPCSGRLLASAVESSDMCHCEGHCHSESPGSQAPSRAMHRFTGTFSDQRLEIDFATRIFRGAFAAHVLSLLLLFGMFAFGAALGFGPEYSFYLLLFLSLRSRARGLLLTLGCAVCVLCF